MKWKIVFHPKPQGLWRPKVSLRLWVEDSEWKRLNINPIFDIKDVVEWAKFFSKPCIACSICLKKYPLILYSSGSPRSNEHICLKNFIIDLEKEPHYERSYFIEFRERAKDYVRDYADYIKFFQDLCQSFVKEYENRIERAKSCISISELVVDENNINSIVNSNSVEIQNIRKIKI
ncbi:MAG: hypothetical protein NZ826_06485 [Thermodesulfovibrio sp.]|nr:hypothetical protein [Thermodesulfovibrio sp.]